MSDRPVDVVIEYVRRQAEDAPRPNFVTLTPAQAASLLAEIKRLRHIESDTANWLTWVGVDILGLDGAPDAGEDEGLGVSTVGGQLTFVSAVLRSAMRKIERLRRVEEAASAYARAIREHRVALAARSGPTAERALRVRDARDAVREAHTGLIETALALTPAPAEEKP